MIKLENVSKVIKGNTVLNDISILLEDGKAYGVKGINGSGKTMLMRVISGLIYPTKGTVLIDGKKLGKDISFPENMGLLLENPAFLDSYSGMKNLEILISLNGKAGKDDIRKALDKVGLNPDDKRKYRKYSLGMKQRLGIAAVIAENPQILIFDEPLNALDGEGISLFSEIITDEKKKGKLIIVSCHDETKLEEYADVMLTMENGKIIHVEEGKKL